MAIHSFTRLIDSNEKIEIHGDGLSQRDYTYIDDIIDGCLGAINRVTDGFDIYNLGNSKVVSLGNLVQIIELALGKKAKINYLPKQPGDVDQTFADIRKARQELDFEPKTDINIGIGRFVEWYRNQKKRG